MPAYFRNSWTELRNVTWPKLPEALRLTLAVILFASIFAIFISGLDWLLDKLFQELILNESQNIKEFLKGIF
ncbi:preprotein translocase subunit SecE [Candidatus Saccharibacteria bacterium]|nr:preprotein translocase subunit SecE [Candidatus Saccharibacteria bacterium]MCB9821511.1 preprotein translocase subunit SecE [Candidatus Nomurabacteria bacterium]